MNPCTQIFFYAACFLCIVLYKYRARTLKGIPMNKGHLPFFGTTLGAVKNILKGNSGFPQFVYEELKGNGYNSFGWSAVGGKMAVVVVEKEDIKFLLKDRFNNFVKSPEFVENFSSLLGQGIFNTDGSVWKEQRNIMAKLFNRRQLRERMSIVFGTHAQALVKVLDNTATTTCKAVNIMPFFYHFTFDCINRVAFNREVSSLEGNEKDVQFQQAFDDIQRGILQRFRTPWWKLNRFLQLPSEQGIATGLKVVKAYVTEVMDQYMEQDGSLKKDIVMDDRTMTGLFLNEERSGGTFDKEFVMHMILNVVIAGRDTMGSALTSAMQCLCEHPEWQDKLHEEAMACSGGNKQDILTFDDVENASVAEAVLFETLRLFPAVPANEKVCLNETTFPSGITVPTDVRVNWVPFATNRYEKLWGDDAVKFNPQRWMDGTHDDYMYSSFNAGPRLCLGKNMAMLEGKIALLTLFANFKFSMREGFVPKMKPSATWQLDSNGLEVFVHKV